MASIDNNRNARPSPVERHSGGAQSPDSQSSETLKSRKGSHDTAQSPRAASPENQGATRNPQTDTTRQRTVRQEGAQGWGGYTPDDATFAPLSKSQPQPLGSDLTEVFTNRTPSPAEEAQEARELEQIQGDEAFAQALDIQENQDEPLGELNRDQDPVFDPEPVLDPEPDPAPEIAAHDDDEAGPAANPAVGGAPADNAEQINADLALAIQLDDQQQPDQFDAPNQDPAELAVRDRVALAPAPPPSRFKRFTMAIENFFAGISPRYAEYRARREEVNELTRVDIPRNAKLSAEVDRARLMLLGRANACKKGYAQLSEDGRNTYGYRARVIENTIRECIGGQNFSPEEKAGVIVGLQALDELLNLKNTRDVQKFIQDFGPIANVGAPPDFREEEFEVPQYEQAVNAPQPDEPRIDQEPDEPYLDPPAYMPPPAYEERQAQDPAHEPAPAPAPGRVTYPDIDENEPNPNP